MEQQRYYVYNTPTQSSETNPCIWVQIADALTAIGNFFVTIGRVLLRIGEFIYEVFFR